MAETESVVASTLDPQTTGVGGAISIRRESLLFWTCWGAYAVLALFCVLSLRHFYSDGCSFFADVLLQKGLYICNNFRRASYPPTQWPVLLCVNVLGIRDLKILAFVYGGAQYFVPLIGLVLARACTERTETALRLWPLLGFGLYFASSSFLMFHETWMLLTYFWICLCVLVSRKPIRLWSGLLLLACLVGVSRSYESFVTLGWVLLLAAVLRLRRPEAKSVLERMASGLAIVASLYGIGAALYTIVFPIDPFNRTTFREAIVIHFVFPTTWLALLVVGGLGAAVAGRAFRMVAWGLFAGACLLGIAIAATPYITPQWIAPVTQYLSRVQTLYLPFLLGLGAVASVYGLPAVRTGAIFWQTPGSPEGQFDGGRWDWPRLEWFGRMSLAVVVGASLLFHFGATLQWRQYLALMREDVRAKRGVVPFEECAVARASAESAKPHADPRQFDWSWTIPTLTILLSGLEGGPVTTIVASSSDGWQPFDPHRAEQLPDLSDYGIVYQLPSADQDGRDKRPDPAAK